MRKSLPVLRVDREDVSSTWDSVAEEFELTIFLDDRELVTLACSPVHMEYLALGFLRSEGFIGGRDDVERVVIDGGVVRVTIKKELNLDMPFRRSITSGCGRGLRFYRPWLGKVRSDMKVSPSVIFELMKEFISYSETFRETGGVHSAAFCDTEKVLIFEEDIGRHNALDKVFGRCLWEGLSTQDGIVLTTGRVSSEVVLKAVRMEVPFLISRSAPTDLAVRFAEDLGLTLVGFVRGRRMNVYAHKERVMWETSLQNA